MGLLHQHYGGESKEVSMIYIGNAFSLQMLDLSYSTKMEIIPVSIQEVLELLATNGFEFESCIGHGDTAKVVSSMLGLNVPCYRRSVKLTPDDVLVVAQVTGGRLPEGATTLPAGKVFLMHRSSCDKDYAGTKLKLAKTAK